MSSEGELILLQEIEFSVVFYVLRYAHKFDSRLVIYCTSKKWQRLESDRALGLWQDLRFVYERMYVVFMGGSAICL